MEIIWKILVAVIVLFLFFIYRKLTSVYDYFEKRNIPHFPGCFIFGSDMKMALLKTSVGLCLAKMYNQMKDAPVFGLFIGLKPYLVVKDPELASRILIPDFEYFHDRGFEIDEELHPMDAHLFFLNGNRWKLLRSLLTPIFTSGKLRFMFPEINKCSVELMNHLDKKNYSGEDVDLKDIFGRFGTDVIASSAFGLEPESIRNPNNEFRKMGQKVFETSLWQQFAIFLMFAAPSLAVRLNINAVPVRVHTFFYNLFVEVFNLRRNTGTKRRDFIQLLLEIKDNKETYEIKEFDELEEDETVSVDNIKEKIEITDKLLAAQSYVFFLAGFETVSDCLNYTVLLLSKNKRAQSKARNEIQTVLKKFNGEYSYEALKEMTYLDDCIKESTRIYPPVGHLNRIVAKDYTFPDGTKIEKGLSVAIPLYAIQHDPDFYRDPEVFYPERYSEETGGKGLYLPFGDGPRHCIGKRFALVEMKLVLARLLENYYLEESKLTEYPVRFLALIQLTPAHPLYVRLVKINQGGE